MFATLINRLITYSNKIVTVIIALSLFVFVYGLIAYIFNSDDENKRKESISYIIAGIIGLFVMTSVWGILQMLSNSFGFNFGIPQITY
ncbi:MAG TPA: hypothetical protein P5328_01135 [Candidatus Paceibacterota bacterium]|nr:hypothetical protein [Candidatus Paceibacterota bacterium]HRZ34590.1 hypothetical protein [Candidatus Paceibacterota bacterium]